jgi:hypothetical protein
MSRAGRLAPGSNVADCTLCDTFCTGGVPARGAGPSITTIITTTMTITTMTTTTTTITRPIRMPKHPLGPESARKAKA